MHDNVESLGSQQVLTELSGTEKNIKISKFSILCGKHDNIMTNWLYSYIIILTKNHKYSKKSYYTEFPYSR